MRRPESPQPCRPAPRAALWTGSLLSLLLIPQSLPPIIEKGVVFPSTRTQTIWVRLLTVNDTKGSAGPALPLPTANLSSAGESLAGHPVCQGQRRNRPSDKQGGDLQFSSVQSLSDVRLFATPWTAACQASLSITISRACSNSCPLSQWCHTKISSSVLHFSSHVFSSKLKKYSIK